MDPGILPPLLLRNAYAYYYFALVIVTAALVVIWFITNSPFGYTLRAIRDNSNRTRFISIDVRKYAHQFCHRRYVYWTGGSLWAPFSRNVAPDFANWTNSGTPVFMTVMGGAIGFFGPLIGSVVYTFLSAFVTGFRKSGLSSSAASSPLWSSFCQEGLPESCGAEEPATSNHPEEE